jgi:two-component system response regulator AdeR
VVEDDPGIAESLRDLFTRERFEVAVATTAADGTAHTLRVNPDLVVLDLRLPDATGFDVCRDLCA